MKKPSKPSDSAYKFLFKNKRVFYQLIKSFVTEDFVKNITLENLELFDKSFVTDDFLERESDLIYKVKIDDKEIFIYILLEFQSKPDKTIPIRMGVYILSMCDLIYKNSTKGKLPNIFPVILYNGSKDWNIPLNIKDLIDKNISEKYIPSFEYFLISEKDVPEEKLVSLRNLISAVFYLERQNDEEGLIRAIDKIIDFIKNEELIDIQMFMLWVSKMFKDQIRDEEILKIKEIREAKSMLTMLAEKIEKRGIEKGIEKGEYNRSLKDAKMMKLENIDIKVISKITGLSISEIDKL